MDYRNVHSLLKYEEFFLFGASTAATDIERFLAAHGKIVVGFSDNDSAKHGVYFHGRPVFSPSLLPQKLNLNENQAIIIASAYQSEIAVQLIEELLIPKERVFPYVTAMFAKHFGEYPESFNKLKKLRERLADDESRVYLDALIEFRQTMDSRLLQPNPLLKGFYFYDVSELGPNENDIIVDVGAYTGDTAMAYLRRLANKARVIALEPLPSNFEMLIRTIANNGYASQITPLPFAAGSERGVAVIMSDNTSEDPRATLRQATSMSKTSVMVETIDDLFSNSKTRVDFIKIDVEGFEPSVIRGAENTLRTFRPGLAIAAYHDVDHLWLLVEMIDQIAPGYSFYLGHHPAAIYECEFFAVNNGD
jgi:FkbM family methyltransferase